MMRGFSSEKSSRHQKIIKPDDFLMTPSDVEPQVISNHPIVFQIRFPIGSEHDTDVFWKFF